MRRTVAGETASSMTKGRGRQQGIGKREWRDGRGVRHDGWSDFWFGLERRGGDSSSKKGGGWTVVERSDRSSMTNDLRSSGMGSL